MPTAILIGFEYTFNSLEGAIIDLYQAHKWCQSFGCQINILTDIQSIKDPGNLRSVIDKNLAGKDLLTFYHRVNPGIVNDKKGLLDDIIKILTLGIPDNKLIIYYSGHGVKDSMVMPDRTLLPFIDFRDNILSYLNPYVEIFWILDCCNPNGMNLPYKLDGNRFVLSPTKIQFVTQPILLITSAETNEKSVATKSGSIFSRYLFNLLSEMNRPVEPIIQKRNIIIPTGRNRNLRRLIGNLGSSIRKMHTGYAQTVSIYSSYITDPVLWMWIGSSTNSDIVTDMSLSSLIIRNNPMTFHQYVPNIKNDFVKSQSSNPYDLIYASEST